MAWIHKVAQAGALVVAGLSWPAAGAVVTVGPVSVVASDRAAGFSQAQRQAIETAWRQSGLGAAPQWSERERERVIRFVDIIEENLRQGYRATVMVGVDLPTKDPAPLENGGAVQVPAGEEAPTPPQRAGEGSSSAAASSGWAPANSSPVVLRRELYRFATLAEWVSVTRKLQREGIPFRIDTLTPTQAIVAIVSN